MLTSFPEMSRKLHLLKTKHTPGSVQILSYLQVYDRGFNFTLQSFSHLPSPEFYSKGHFLLFNQFNTYPVELTTELKNILLRKPC